MLRCQKSFEAGIPPGHFLQGYLVRAMPNDCEEGEKGQGDDGNVSVPR
jgi:hypothetical protein